MGNAGRDFLPEFVQLGPIQTYPTNKSVSSLRDSSDQRGSRQVREVEPGVGLQSRTGKKTDQVLSNTQTVEAVLSSTQTVEEPILACPVASGQSTRIGREVRPPKHLRDYFP